MKHFLIAVLAILAPQARAGFSTCIALTANGTGANTSAATYASYAGGAFCGISSGFSYTADAASSVSPTSLALGVTNPTMTLTDTNSSAYGKVDLADASLHGYANAVNTSGAPGFQLELQDILHWSTGGPATITIGAHVDGIKNVNGGSDNDSYTLSFGTASFSYLMNTNSPFFGPINILGWNSTSFTNQSATGFDFSGTLTVNNLDAINVVMGLQGFPRNGASDDFSNTAKLSLSFGSGVSFTSDSGVFLTQPASTTPEPATLATAALALAAIAIRRWNRSSV